jgi:thiamine pyrophosphokinase
LNQTKSKRAVIFANGSLGDPRQAQKAIRPGDWIIAADGGGRHCLALGILPDLLVGDMDSLDPETVIYFETSGTRVIRYPVRKDFTDLELAVIHAQEEGIEEILILAALGDRWDQTLANLLLPARANFSGSLRIRLLDGLQEIQLIEPGKPVEVDGMPGDTLSLVPLGGDTSGITTTGLEYPLSDEKLFFGSTRGISNVLTGQNGTIQVNDGLLCCILIHHSPVNED